MRPSACFACYTVRVEYPRRNVENARNRGRTQLSYTRVIGIVRISRAGVP